MLIPIYSFGQDKKLLSKSEYEKNSISFINGYVQEVFSDYSAMVKIHDKDDSNYWLEFSNKDKYLIPKDHKCFATSTGSYTDVYLLETSNNSFWCIVMDPPLDVMSLGGGCSIYPVNLDSNGSFQLIEEDGLRVYLHGVRSGQPFRGEFVKIEMISNDSFYFIYKLHKRYREHKNKYGFGIMSFGENGKSVHYFDTLLDPDALPETKIID